MEIKDFEDFKGFYSRSFEERLNLLLKLDIVNHEDFAILKSFPASLPENLADKMIENSIGVFSLPLGIATNFIINDIKYVVPMVTEEPSVIAGASKAAKIASFQGGFKTTSSRALMIGQIQLCNLHSENTLNILDDMVNNNLEEFQKIAQESDPVLYEHGGGLEKVWVKELTTSRGVMYIIEFSIDVKDAMGANAVNTIAEAIGRDIENKIDGKINLRILSNHAVLRTATATALFDPKQFGGLDIMNNILDAQVFAEADPFRATTHNKGIMNGISALTLATGNDTRAIESAAHSFSCKSGTYLPLTKYEETKNQMLYGELTIPVPLGIIGGSTSYHPMAILAKKLLNINTSNQLGEIAAALGLAQNFAALLALSGKGIQDAHMKLHKRKD